MNYAGLLLYVRKRFQGLLLNMGAGFSFQSLLHFEKMRDYRLLTSAFDEINSRFDFGTHTPFGKMTFF